MTYIFGQSSFRLQSLLPCFQDLFRVFWYRLNTTMFCLEVVFRIQQPNIRSTRFHNGNLGSSNLNRYGAQHNVISFSFCKPREFLRSSFRCELMSAFSVHNTLFTLGMFPKSVSQFSDMFSQFNPSLKLGYSNLCKIYFEH